MKTIKLFEEFINETYAIDESAAVSGIKGNLSKDDIEIPKFKIDLSKLIELRDKIGPVYSKRWNLYKDYSKENRQLELDAIDKEMFGLVNNYNVEARKVFVNLMNAISKLQLPKEAGLDFGFKRSEGKHSLATLGYGDDHYNTPLELKVKNVFQGFLGISWYHIPPRARKKQIVDRDITLSDLLQGFIDIGEGARRRDFYLKGDKNVFTDEKLIDFLTADFTIR